MTINNGMVEYRFGEREREGKWVIYLINVMAQSSIQCEQNV